MIKQKEGQRFLGIKILGGLNCFFGLTALFNYFAVTPENFDKLSRLLKENNLSQEISLQQFKASGHIFILTAIILLVSGLGLIFRKEWARKLILYFSFAAVVIIFLSIIAQPALIGFFITYIIYFGIFIVYFTNKNIEKCFTPALKEKNKEQEE